MPKYLGIAGLLTILAAPALAQPEITEVWFWDDFESYWDGYLGPPNWPDYRRGEKEVVADPQGDLAVRVKGVSGSGAAWDAMSSSFAPYSTGDPEALEVFRFTLQSDLNNQGDIGNHLTVWLNETTGGELARWYGWSSNIAPRYDGFVGPGVDIRDGAVHEFGIVYDPVTGLCEWWHNGGLQWSHTLLSGLAADRLCLEDVSRGANDYIYLDDVVVGSPEPAALALLGLGVPWARRKGRR